MTTLTPHQELDRLHERSSAHLAQSLSAIQAAELRGDARRALQLLDRLGKDLGALLAAADLLGRRRMLLELGAAGIETDEEPESAQFAALPQVPFTEAVKSILKRYPVLVAGWREAQAAWAREGFALAKSTSLTITQKVKRSFVKGLRGGLTEEETVQRIHRQLREGDDSITRAYADTVFRTVTSSAYTAGRQAQALRPGVIRAASGWRYVATMDSNVRGNHLAGDDFVAHVEDPVWRVHAPPNGFQCRCALEIVPTSLMVQLGLSNPDGTIRRTVNAPAGFVPDPGFRATA